MDILSALRTNDPTIFIPIFLEIFERDTLFATNTLEYLRSPDNLINPYSKKACRFILFLISINYPETYKTYLPNYFKKACWVDALHIYRYRTLWGYETNTPQTQHYELELLANAILANDILAAKWAPSEKSAWNHPPLSAAKIVASLAGLSPKEYRKKLTHLRTNILETKLSEQRFDEIEIADIPKSALHSKKDALSRNCNYKGEVSTERINLRNRYLSWDSPQTTINPYLSGVCVLDNYLLAREGYDFVAWISRNCECGHFARRVINMGEFVGMAKLPAEGDIEEFLGGMVFGGGVLNLVGIYEFILGQILMYKLCDIPKFIYVLSDTPLRNVPSLGEVEKLYGGHHVRMPMVIYINFGKRRRHRRVYEKYVIEVFGVGELSLAIALGEIGFYQGDINPIPARDYTNVSKIFFW